MHSWIEFLYAVGKSHNIEQEWMTSGDIKRHNFLTG